MGAGERFLRWDNSQCPLLHQQRPRWHPLFMMRLLVIVLLAIVGVFVFLGLDLAEHDALLVKSNYDASKFSDNLLKEGYYSTACEEDDAGRSDDRELNALMSAITTAENFARPWPERIAKDQIVLILSVMGLPAPEWSLGDGEIRLRTAEKAIRAVSPAWSERLASQKQLVARLLDKCGNHQIGKLILRNIALQKGFDVTSLNRNSIFTLASEYNGQASFGNLSGRASKVFYQEVIYHLFYTLLLSAKLQD
jgi:hypothetical protein